MSARTQRSEGGVGWGGVDWILRFAVAATVAWSPVSDEQVAHWARPFKSESLAFDFLVRARWTEGEAAERGIVVTDEDARDAAEDEQPRGGLTRRDLIYEAKLVLLTAGIKAQIAEPAAKSVTPDQVDAYVNANPKQLPERRRVRLVRARTRHDAAQAKKRIDNGLAWKTAAKTY